ncbi:MAG: KEOPS complex kinase/ATPase Bud32 [Candidatus Woesearchaeota archaeon]
MDLIGKGAEADIFFDGEIVKKIRSSKSYRLPELDLSLRKKRTRSEARILKKIGVIGPGFISSNDVDEIRMGFLKGPLLKHVLDNDVSLAKQVGFVVGSLHDLNIVHGDLTTSNMILTNSNKVQLIDFGLSFISDKIEDKAVDLHLFREAISSKHFLFEKIIWDKFVEGYAYKNKSAVLKRLGVVELRGRNKQKY